MRANFIDQADSRQLRGMLQFHGDDPWLCGPALARYAFVAGW
jgi:hypothetical protein